MIWKILKTSVTNFEAKGQNKIACHGWTGIYTVTVLTVAATSLREFFFSFFFWVSAYSSQHVNWKAHATNRDSSWAHHNPGQAPDKSWIFPKLLSRQSHADLPAELPYGLFPRGSWWSIAAGVSPLLPLDLQGYTAMDGDRDHEGDGGEGQKNCQFQIGDFKWKGLRGEISEGVSDERCFYVVGDPPVVTEIPRESAWSGVDVRLRWLARDSVKVPSWAQCHRSSTVVSVLRGWCHVGYRLPWLVILGLVFHFHFFSSEVYFPETRVFGKEENNYIKVILQAGNQYKAMGIIVEGAEGREREEQVGGKRTSCLLEGKPSCGCYQDGPSQV